MTEQSELKCPRLVSRFARERAACATQPQISAQAPENSRHDFW